MCPKFDKVVDKDQLFGRYNLPKVIQDEIDNMNSTQAIKKFLNQ